MKNINLYLLSLSFFILFTNSNIWDNIFSQVKSPHFVIPNNFQVLLFNENDNSTLGELYVSSDLSLIKFSFILDESGSKDAFIHLLIDFNDGKIYFDTEEKCVYMYYDIVEQISPKFILNAYDLLSYFSEDENNYHYIVINPLELAEVDDEVSKLPSLLKNILQDIDKIVLQNQKTIYEKTFYVDFIINKKELTIKTITIKAKDSFINFNSLFTSSNIEKEKFNGIHSLSSCTEYKN